MLPRHTVRSYAAALAIGLGVGIMHTASAVPTATILKFSEQDEGAAPYEARMVVTPKYLRMDNGSDAGGFVLLDRATNAVYSVSRMDRTILVIRPTKIPLPRPTEFRQQVLKDKGDFPAVVGKKVVHYTFFTNGRRCFDVYAAAGLLPDAVAALREYQLALAGQQAATEAKMPPSMRSVCDLANYVFRPARYLDYGFPVRQRDDAGTTRQLLDYKTAVPVASSLFVLPSGYRRYSVK